MVPISLPKVLTTDEVAKLLQVAGDDVTAECEAGRLGAVKLGGKWRITEDSLRDFLGVVASIDSARGAPSTVSEGDGAVWQPIGPFKHSWPNGDTEKYEFGFECDAGLPEGRTHFVVGYTNRKAAGMDRRRVVVFKGHIPQAYPLVEFAGANDHKKTQMVASVMKDRDNHHVRSVAQVPAEYAGIPTAVYSDVVIGPYAVQRRRVCQRR